VAKKTKISNGDLTALFYERIRASSGCPVGIHLAIVPNKTYGWTALMNPTQRDKHPVFAKRFDALLAELRETYDLAGS
jgi:hypothetical protein